MDVKYFSALYWATVTCTTVGYGDITPTNKWEMAYALVIIIIGVSFFSYILSNLCGQFADLLKTKAKNIEKIDDFQKIQKKFHLDQDLIEKITQYLKN